LTVVDTAVVDAVFLLVQGQRARRLTYPAHECPTLAETS
jgi:hypothetical protein